MCIYMAAKHTGETKFSVAESIKMIQKMEKDAYEDIVKTVIETIEMAKKERFHDECVCLKSKELLAQSIMNMNSCFLIYTSIIERGDDLLKEQQYEEYDMAYFQLCMPCQLTCGPTQVIIIIFYN